MGKSWLVWTVKGLSRAPQPAGLVITWPGATMSLYVYEINAICKMSAAENRAGDEGIRVVETEK